MKAKLLFLSMFGLITVANASDFKLGYVDVPKLFAVSKPALALQAAVKAKFEPGKAQLESMNTALLNEQKSMLAIIKKAPSADKLSKEDRTNLEKMDAQYKKDNKAFQDSYVSYEQQLQRAQDYSSQQILNQANIILKNISEKNGYDLVVTSNQLVYAKPKYDVTDLVIDELNKLDSTEMVNKLKTVESQPLTVESSNKSESKVAK